VRFRSHSGGTFGTNRTSRDVCSAVAFASCGRIAKPSRGHPRRGIWGSLTLPVAGRAFSFRGYALARLRGGANHRCFNSLLTRPDSTALVEAAGRL